MGRYNQKQRKPFTVQVGPRTAGGRLRNGDCDGFFWVRVQITATIWYGPFKTSAAAQTKARGIIQQQQDINPLDFFRVSWGKRYWLLDEKKWYLRTALGEEDLDVADLPVTNDEFTPVCAPVTLGYFGQVRSAGNSGSGTVLDVGTALINGMLPGSDNYFYTRNRAPLSGTIHAPLTQTYTGIVHAVEGMFTEGVEPYWVPASEGWGPFTSALCVVMDGLSIPSICTYFPRPDTPYPNDDIHDVQQDTGPRTTVASNGVFFSHLETVVTAVRRKTNILPTTYDQVQTAQLDLNPPSDATPATLTGKAPYTDTASYVQQAPSLVYADSTIISGNAVHEATFDITGIVRVVQQSRPGTFNNVHLYPANMGCVPRPGFFGEDTWVGPVSDGAFPAYPAKLVNDGDTRFQFWNGTGPVQAIAPQTAVIECDIEVTAVYVVREGGVGSEVYYSSEPYKQTVAAMREVFGPQTGYEAISLPIYTSDTRLDYNTDRIPQTANSLTPTSNRVPFLQALNTPSYPGVIAGYAAAVRYDVVRPWFPNPYSSPSDYTTPPPVVNTVFTTTLNDTMMPNSATAEGSQMPFSAGLDSSKYVISETFTVTHHDGVARYHDLTPDYGPYPVNKVQLDDFDKSFNYLYTPFKTTAWQGTAARIRPPFDSGTSLPYPVVDDPPGIEWQVPFIFGEASGDPTLSFGPTPPDPPKKMFFQGTMKIWKSVLNSQPLFDNSSGQDVSSSWEYHAYLDDGSLIYMGVGDQNTGTQIPTTDPGFAITGYDGRESAAIDGSIVNFEDKPTYAVGPITVFINSDVSGTLVTLPENGGIYPNPDDKIVVGVTDGPEVGKLGTVRRMTASGEVSLTIYDRPQLRLIGV